MEPEIEILNTIIHLEKRRNKLNVEINNKKNKLKLICKHSDIETKETYIDADYYNTSEYITRKVCKIYKKELSKVSKYGGFC